MSHVSPETVLRYLEGTLAPEERRDVEVHIDGCDDCRRLIAESAPTKPPRGDVAMPASLPSVPFEHYLIEDELGRGGLGKILRARHLPLQRTVALKELIRQTSVNLDGRFVREALVTAGLQHPGIVPLYEAGRWPTGELFYSMKLVEGKTLQELIRDRRTLAERIALLPNLIAVGEALAYAHSRRVIHRDIKPSNILVGEFGETVLIDWGLAKQLPEDKPRAAAWETGASRPGDVIGTPLYMSPEQSMGEPADLRSDVYSFGVVLYELLAADSPYATKGSAKSLLVAVRTGDIVPLGDRQPEVPVDLATIVHKALARDPDRRYGSAKELVEDLKRFETGQLVSARRYSTWERIRRWLARRRAPVAVAAASLAVLMALGAVSVLRIDRARRQAEASVAQLHLEQGRLGLLAGDPMRALVYLSAAAGEGKDGPALRFLARRATQGLERRLLVLGGHTQSVPQVVYSPDGRRLVTVSNDQTAAVWDAQTGARLHQLLGHRGRIVAAAFSPDGRVVATGCFDRTARLWDVDSGRLLHTLAGHTGRVQGVAFSPDGALVLTRSDDGTARLYDAATGTERAVVKAHEGGVGAAAWFPDGKSFVTAGADKTARVWGANGEPRCVATGHTQGVGAVAVSPAGDRFVTGGFDRIAIVWSTACVAERELVGHRDAVLAAAFDATGARLVTAGTDGTAKLWRPASGGLLYSFEGHGGAVAAVAFSHDGTRVVTASDDRTARLWNTGSGRLESVLAGHVAELRSATFSPDDKRVIVSGRDGSVVAWDAQPEGLVATIPASGGRVVLARFLPGGEVLVVSDAGDGICPPMRTDSRNWATGCELSTDGSVVLRLDGDTASAVDRVTGEPRASLRHPVRILLHALTPDGGGAITASEDGTVVVWDTRTGAVRGRLPLSEGIRAVALSPDGSRAATAISEQGITVWDVATRAKIVAFPMRLGRFAALEFDPRGERLVGPILDGTVTVWDATTGAAVVTLEAPPTTTVAGVFSPDGRFIAASAEDNTTRVYDAQSGALLHNIRHGDFFSAPQFAPDGARIVTSGADGTARVWDVSLDPRGPPALAAFVRCRVPFRLADEALWPAAPVCN